MRNGFYVLARDPRRSSLVVFTHDEPYRTRYSAEKARRGSLWADTEVVFVINQPARKPSPVKGL